ncbi:MAG: hypothetical protein RSB67_00330 [Clostridia bacterium]
MKELSNKKPVALIYDISVLKENYLNEIRKEEKNVFKIIPLHFMKLLSTKQEMNLTYSKIISSIRINQRIQIRSCDTMYNTNSYINDSLLMYALVLKKSQEYSDVCIRTIDQDLIVICLNFGIKVVCNLESVEDVESEIETLNVISQTPLIIDNTIFVYDSCSVIGCCCNNDFKIIENKVQKVFFSCVIDECKKIMQHNDFIKLIYFLQKKKNNVKFIHTIPGYNSNIILTDINLLANTINLEILEKFKKVILFTSDKEMLGEATYRGLNIRLSSEINGLINKNEPKEITIKDAKKTFEDSNENKLELIVEKAIVSNNDQNVEPKQSITINPVVKEKKAANKKKKENKDKQLEFKFHQGVWICASKGICIYNDESFSTELPVINHCKKIYFYDVKPGDYIKFNDNENLYVINKISANLKASDLELYKKK